MGDSTTGPEFLLTTDPGLEDVCAAELVEARPDAEVQAAPAGCRGRVLARLERPDDLLRLATAHHVLELRGRARVCSLDEIEHAVSRAPFPELESAASFRVSCRRTGRHEFSSVDVQRRAGAVLHRRHRTPVDLEDFAVEIRVDLDGEWLSCGVPRTRVSLGDRIRRTVALRSALKPTVAAAMLRLVGAHRGVGRLLDPMCGSGTIPLEARRLNPRLEIAASDWDPRTLEVARQTLAAHGVEIELREADARSLSAVYGSRFDYIVTDPPYGVRQARRSSRTRLYAALLASFAEVLDPAGRVALIVLKYAAFRAGLARSGLRLTHERRVDLGAISPRIVLLERARPAICQTVAQETG